MFQSYALWPHLTVERNVSFPAEVAGAAPRDWKALAAKHLGTVGLTRFAERRPAELSGGQRQRVALARVLASDARLVLMDEPLANLDPHLRATMEAEFLEFHRLSGATTVYITHDQREAMTMADLVVVMRQGRIRQAAPPVEIYRNPADSFVADFIGSTNLVPIETGAVLGRPLPGTRPKGVLSVRPEDIVLGPPEGAMLAGEVVFVRALGATVETFVQIAGQTLTAVGSPRGPRHAVGDMVGVTLPADACVVLAA